MDMQLNKKYAEQDMEYYDSLPKDIRKVVSEYGEYPFHGEDAEDLQSRCESWRQYGQQFLLTSSM
jgi:hypothetical protein